MSAPSTGIVLDLDGTLVDSVFHHVLAWDDAFQEAGYAVPLWKVHAAIGMGSKRLITWVLQRPMKELGEALEQMSDAHERRFLERAGALRATDGALDLLTDLDEREIPYVIATSSHGEMTDALVAALARDGLDILSGDTAPSSKPAPDPVLQACEHLGIEPRYATMVGDSPWDAETAVRAGARAVGVRCGGFSTTALLDAGATIVADDPRNLIGRL